MLETIRVSEARLERTARWVAALVRFVAEVTDRQVLSRLGPRGMMAVTLPLLALAQSLLPRWGLFGGAPLPLVWCSVAYYMLRFRLAYSLAAAVGGGLLAWLASQQAFWSGGGVLLVVALAGSVLRRWLYAEFWPAHAFACGLMAFAVPLASAVVGLPSPVASFHGFLATLAVAPVVGTVLFGLLEAVRKRMGVEIDFPEETPPDFDPAYLYRPFASR